MEWDDDIEESKVNSVCESIKASLPRGWVEMIERERERLLNWGIGECQKCMWLKIVKINF